MRIRHVTDTGGIGKYRKLVARSGIGGSGTDKRLE